MWNAKKVDIYAETLILGATWGRKEGGFSDGGSCEG